MIINNDIKDLILEYVGRYFKFENDFYRLPNVKFTDANWQKRCYFYRKDGSSTGERNVRLLI